MKECLKCKKQFFEYGGKFGSFCSKECQTSYCRLSSIPEYYRDKYNLYDRHREWFRSLCHKVKAKRQLLPTFGGEKMQHGWVMPIKDLSKHKSRIAREALSAANKEKYDIASDLFAQADKAMDILKYYREVEGAEDLEHWEADDPCNWDCRRRPSSFAVAA